MIDVVGAREPIRGEAYSVCRQLVVYGSIPHRDKTVVAAASLMLACRLHGRVLDWSDIPDIRDKEHTTGVS